MPPPTSQRQSLKPPRGAFALSRLRKSVVLRACAALAVVEYGALLVWGVFGRAPGPSAPPAGAWIGLAGWLALCSLGSWFFLFLWYPFLETLQAKETGDGAATRLGRVLETFAIGCVAVVHGMLLLILVQASQVAR